MGMVMEVLSNIPRGRVSNIGQIYDGSIREISIICIELMHMDFYLLRISKLDFSATDGRDIIFTVHQSSFKAAYT